MDLMTIAQNEVTPKQQKQQEVLYNMLPYPLRVWKNLEREKQKRSKPDHRKLV